mgnify:CR=1 FL=1
MICTVLYANEDVLSDEKNFDFFYSQVNSARKEKISSLIENEKKRLSLLAELLLIYALKKENVDYSKCVFHTNEYDKPYITNHKDFYYNISHTDGLVILTCSSKEVGCDAEKIKSADFDKIIRIFSDKEIEKYNLIKLKKRKKTYFFKCWTKKESLAKLYGTSVFLNNDGGVTKTFTLKNEYVVSVSMHDDFTLKKQRITEKTLKKAITAR